MLYRLLSLTIQVAAVAASYATAVPNYNLEPSATTTTAPVCTGIVAQTVVAAPVCSQVTVGAACGWLCRTVLPQTGTLVACNQFVGCPIYKTDSKTGGVRRCKRRRGTGMPCTADYCCVRPVPVVPPAGPGAGMPGVGAERPRELAV